MIKLDLSLVLQAILLVLVFILVAVLITLLIMLITNFQVKRGVIKKEKSLAYSDWLAKMFILLMILFALIYCYLYSKKSYRPLSINSDTISRELILPWKKCLNNSKPYYLTGQIKKPIESNINISYI